MLVEGQLDALRCWSVGLKSAIAPQGTSITESQLVLLRRYQSQVECFLDGDSAGQKAAMRFLPMALKAGLEVKFLVLAKGDDPDSLFREHGLAAYEEVRRSASSAMSFACRTALPDPAAASSEQKSRAAQTLLELVAAAESEVSRSEFLAEAASHLRLSHAALQRDFQTFISRQSRQAAARPAANSPLVPVKPAATNTHTTEQHLLILCLHFETLGKALSLTVPHDWIDTTHAAGVLLNRFLGEFENDTWPGRDHLDGLLETSEEKTLAASLLFDTPAIDDPVKVANEGLRQLRSRALEPRLRQIELALANHGADSNSDPISLLKERSDIQRQLRQPLSLPVTV